jgi:hypothetical protein
MAFMSVDLEDRENDTKIGIKSVLCVCLEEGGWGCLCMCVHAGCN